MNKIISITFLLFTVVGTLAFLNALFIDQHPKQAVIALFMTLWTFLISIMSDDTNDQRMKDSAFYVFIGSAIAAFGCIISFVI